MASKAVDESQSPQGFYGNHGNSQNRSRTDEQTIVGSGIEIYERDDEITVRVSSGKSFLWKSTFVNHVLGRKVQHTGVAPTDDSFTVIAGGNSDMDQDGAYDLIVRDAARSQ